MVRGRGSAGKELTCRPGSGLIGENIDTSDGGGGVRVGGRIDSGFILLTGSGSLMLHDCIVVCPLAFDL